MPGLLGSLYSQGNVAKRKLADLLGNPIESLQQIIGYGVDRAKAFDELSKKATDEYLATKSFKGPYQNQLSDLMAEAYNPVGMTVWHGSPAQFSRFDPTKIGSGEGAQAYGYGHYVAESPGVAKDYQRKLGKSKLLLDGIEVGDKRDVAGLAKTALSWKGGDIELTKKMLSEYANAPSADSKTYKSVLNWITENENRLKFDQGSLYKIDLPDEQIAKMLDWDKPLSQQSQEIQSIAKNLGLSLDDLGGDLVAAANAKLPKGAEQLRQAGIPGIKYYDAQSRGGQQSATQNFVVFPGNEELLKILERNGGLLD